MRIGIDARSLTHTQEGGFKTYTENLVHGIAATDWHNEYVLYTEKRADEMVAYRPNISVVPVGGQAVVREQMLLPAAMSKHNLDVAHFPCNTGPVIKPCRMVLTIHDMIPLMPGHELRRGVRQRILAAYWRATMPAAARRADHIITTSEASKEDIVRMIGIPAEKISVIPTGLHHDIRPSRDQERMSRVREKYQLPEQYVLGFASSDPRKNVDVMLQAAKLLTLRKPDVSLTLIACSRRAWRSVQEVAAKYGLQPCIVDCPPRKDLVDIYTMAGALAFPSLYEGFGLPVIEAMACGTPVAASDASSLPEVAGDAAILVDPKDPFALADALTQVLSDADLRAQLVSRGLARAAEFTWQRTIEKTIAVYEKLCPEGLCDASPQAMGGHAR
jgi:glycosyltransferase involved in cell wall biosynthesis